MKAVLVMFKPDGEARSFPVTRSSTTLGRGDECTLRIPVDRVSRRHCELIQNNGHLLIKDLGSSNGTYVNGKRVVEAKLKAGDRLQVGPVIFTLQVDGKPAKIKPIVSKPAAPAAADEFTLKHPSGEQSPPAVSDEAGLLEAADDVAADLIDSELVESDLSPIELGESDLKQVDAAELEPEAAAPAAAPPNPAPRPPADADSDVPISDIDLMEDSGAVGSESFGSMLEEIAAEEDSDDDLRPQP